MPPFFVEDMTDAQKAEYFSFFEKTKGGHTMSCEHKRIKSVNCEIFCMDCNEKLPIDYLVGKERIAEQNKAAEPAEEPKEAPKKTKKTTKKGA